jgi:ATP-dependent DNA helicase RecG
MQARGGRSFKQTYRVIPFEGRLEIINPGGLPHGLSEADFGRISVRRNELIADLFYRLDKVERAGTGIQRMNETMSKAGLSLPEIKHGNFFTIILKRPDPLINQQSGEKLGERRRRIVDAIRENNQITTKELAELIGVSATAIERNISKLKIKGILRRVGPDKGGYWEVIDQ